MTSGAMTTCRMLSTVRSPLPCKPQQTLLSPVLNGAGLQTHTAALHRWYVAFPMATVFSSQECKWYSP
jgi:hypothetical protein